MKQNQTILLISGEPGRFENLSFMLRQNGYNVLSARDGSEGFRLIRRESPDLVISEMNLPVISALELCRMIRADREFWTTPLMFVDESLQDCAKLFEILDAGADECIAEISNPQHLAVKAGWLIKRNLSQNFLTQSYEILRSRQMHITQIIKGTAKLFTAPKFESGSNDPHDLNDREFGKNLCQRLDLGMNMVGALANLLEEQVNVLETWRQTQCREEFAVSRDYDNENSELNYEGLTYEFINGKFPIH